MLNLPEKGSFIYRLGAIDQMANSFINKGSRDQTFSARSYEGRTHGIRWCIIAEKILDFIFFWEPQHCKVSFFTDPTELTYTVKYLAEIKLDKENKMNFFKRLIDIRTKGSTTRWACLVLFGVGAYSMFIGSVPEGIAYWAIGSALWGIRDKQDM